MTVQRQYEPFTLFNVRIVDMRHLWVPSDTYKGQKQQKANYFAGFITPKTQAQWMNEPALSGLVQALGKLYANNPQIVDWRVEDGDTPNAEGKSSEFAKRHWLFNGSSGNPINVEIVQPNQQLSKLQNKVGVKSGDFCMIGGTVAVSGQNNRAAKIYLNAVVFTAPGEEIVFANSVSGAELMQQAQRQGFQPVGFNPSPGGFPGGGFGGQPQQPGFPGAPQGGFTPPAGGFAPNQGQPAFGGAPAPNGGGFGGNAQFPSNPGQPQPGFPGAPQQQPGGGQQWPGGGQQWPGQSAGPFGGQGR